MQTLLGNRTERRVLKNGHWVKVNPINLTLEEKIMHIMLAQKVGMKPATNYVHRRD